jgi:hypothetical protein
VLSTVLPAAAPYRFSRVDPKAASLAIGDDMFAASAFALIEALRAESRESIECELLVSAVLSSAHMASVCAWLLPSIIV